MKFQLIVAVIAMSLITVSNEAATTSGSTKVSSNKISRWYQELKKSPLSLRYINEISARRDPANPKRIRGVGIMNYFSLGYKFSDKNKVSYVSRWDSKEDRGISDRNTTRWTYTELNYYRSGLLKEADHGVNATFHFRQRLYPENLKSEIAKVPGKKTFVGYTRPGVILSKKLAERFSLSWGTYFAVYNRVTGADGQSASYFYTYPTLSYSITDKWGVGLTNEYFRLFKKGENKASPATTDIENLSTTVETWYQLHPQLTVSASLGAVTMESDDNRLFAKNIDENFSMAVAASIAAF